MIPRRLPHVLTRNDLAYVLAETYAASAQVDFDEAHERLERALGNPRVLDSLYGGVAAALQERKGVRATEDELLDRLSAGVQQRRSRVKAAPTSSSVSAVMVLLNLELGFAAEMMRGTLETPKGRALLDEGLRALGAHVLKELLK